MNTFNENITTERLTTLLVILLIVGYGIQFLNSQIQFGGTVLFVDLGLTILTVIAITNIYMEKNQYE